MGMHLLIAVPRDITRRGLRAIFSEDQDITSIHEATCSEALQERLECSPTDFVIAHQSLITDIEALPGNHFVIIAGEPNRSILLKAFAHGVCGYFLEDISIELLQIALRLPKGQCLLDPALTLWILNNFSGDTKSIFSNILTSREQQILNLRSEGFSNHEIAKQLCLSVNTVKTHISHISHKLDMR